MKARTSRCKQNTNARVYILVARLNTESGFPALDFYLYAWLTVLLHTLSVTRKCQHLRGVGEWTAVFVQNIELSTDCNYIYGKFDFAPFLVEGNILSLYFSSAVWLKHAEVGKHHPATLIQLSLLIWWFLSCTPNSAQSRIMHLHHSKYIFFPLGNVRRGLQTISVISQIYCFRSDLPDL